MNQCQNPLERGSRLKPDGYGLGQAVRGALVWTEGLGLGTSSDGVSGDRDAGRVSVATGPQGKSWAPIPSNERQ